MATPLKIRSVNTAQRACGGPQIVSISYPMTVVSPFHPRILSSPDAAAYARGCVADGHKSISYSHIASAHYGEAATAAAPTIACDGHAIPQHQAGGTSHVGRPSTGWDYYSIKHNAVPPPSPGKHLSGR